MSISRGDLGVVIYFFLLNAGVIYIAASRWFELRRIPVPSRRGDTTFALCIYLAIAVYVAMSLFFVIGVNESFSKRGDLSGWSEHVRFWLRLYTTIGLLPLTLVKIAGELLLIGALARRQPLNQPLKKGNAYMWAVNILIWVVIILPFVLNFTMCRSGSGHGSCPVWWAPKATPAVAFMHVLLTGVLLFSHWQALRLWDDRRPSTPNTKVAFGTAGVAALVELAWALTIMVMVVQGKREYGHVVVVFCLMHVVLFLALQAVLRADLEARKARAMEVPGLLGQQDHGAGAGFSSVNMDNRA